MLTAFGLTPDIQNAFDQFPSSNKYTLARLTAQYQGILSIQYETGSCHAKISGKLRYKTKQKVDMPVVGDWLVVSNVEDELAIIHEVLPRHSLIARKSVGHGVTKQAIAANIDTAFFIESLERDLNYNRIERYIHLIRSGNAEPVLVLNKTDLCDKETLARYQEQLNDKLSGVPIVLSSTKENNGLSALSPYILPTKTICLIGISGVGKSSMLNALEPALNLETKMVSEATGKGMHTTTIRELHVLANGAILIDTPGMRELGITELDEATLHETFEEIAKLEPFCKFNNCTHQNEPGCAVKEAVKKGLISESQLAHYIKLKAEAARFEKRRQVKHWQEKKLSRYHKKRLDEDKFHQE